METKNIPLDSPLCLICCSVVISPDIKLEISDDDKSIFVFLLRTILEIPEIDIVHQEEKINTWQLSTTFYCETCSKLIYSAKAIFTQVFELTRKFRKVQKQIVEQISNSEDLHPPGTSWSSSNYIGILKFCRNFLNKHDFNGFGYPFVVNEIPAKTSLPFSLSPQAAFEGDDQPEECKVKEEPTSENEDDHSSDNCGADDNDEDYYQAEEEIKEEDTADEDAGSGSESDLEPPPKKTFKQQLSNSNTSQSIEDDLENSSSSSADDSRSSSESDPDLEPLPPPKQTAKKVPIKKSMSSSSPRKSPSSSSVILKPPRQRKKPIPPKKQSRFDILYPNYPKRVRDPTTKRFHCLEPPCTKTFPKKTSVERHIIVQHLQDNFFKCDCGKSFSAQELYQDHVSWHAGIPRWKCEEKVTSSDGQTMACTEAFFARRKLTRHVQKVHHNDKPFICEICGGIFSCQDYLTSHTYLKHTEKGKEKTIQNTSTANPQICDYCGKSYSTKSALETHINMVHEKTVGKFACQFCELKFLRKIWLKQHCWRKHEKFSLEGYQPKPCKVGSYQCDVKSCKMTFIREETWRKHMEDKHGEGKEGVYEFTCKYCGKGFHIKRKCEYHEEAHENKESKPFSCELCGNRFARMPYLKMHKQNVHKIPMEKARKKVLN